jgi:L-threonylcarbamoyladenylate synthase
MLTRRTRVVRVNADAPASYEVENAARVIRDGGLVVFPTETVYGLGADALNVNAVRQIFAAKGRPSTDPLIVHVAGLDQVASVARVVPDVVQQLGGRFWPGALTVIVWKRREVPDEVTAGLETVAIRVPSHPIALALIAAAGRPIAAPSANRFSRPSPTDVSHVLADLDGRVDVILDGGRTDIGVESTVLDLTVSPPVVRRPGGVSIEDLRDVLPQVQIAAQHMDGDIALTSPGQLLRHYAPRARMTLIEGAPDAARSRAITEARQRLAGSRRIGLLVPGDDVPLMSDSLREAVEDGRIVVRGYGMRTDAALAARDLFAAIRTLDATGPDEILAVSLPPEGIGLAIHDRLMRASEGRIILA